VLLDTETTGINTAKASRGRGSHPWDRARKLDRRWVMILR
jgi:hypothetical protein